MPDTTPDGGTIVSETFTSRDGRTVAADDPEAAFVEVEVVYPDGRTERTYGSLRPGGTRLA